MMIIWSFWEGIMEEFRKTRDLLPRRGKFVVFVTAPSWVAEVVEADEDEEC